jgi:hypothetical protein
MGFAALYPSYSLEASLGLNVGVLDDLGPFLDLGANVIGEL